MHFGAAYYPEYWPRQRWATDARLMQDVLLDRSIGATYVMPPRDVLVLR